MGREVRRWPAVLAATGGALVATGAALAIAFKVSPWPRVLLIRSTGNDGMADAEANEPFVPDDVDASLDLVYDARSAQGRLDVFRPAAASAPLPAVVWVHGGGFVAGNKAPLRPYLKVLASHGFVAVNVEHPRARGGLADPGGRGQQGAGPSGRPRR